MLAVTVVPVVVLPVVPDVVVGDVVVPVVGVVVVVPACGKRDSVCRLRLLVSIDSEI